MVEQVDHPTRRRLLIILARAPVPGKTKTRLGATIGMERASDLYKAFLADLATRFSPCRLQHDCAVAWAATPESKRFPSILRELVGAESADGIIFLRQCGANLGSRQVNLLRWGHDQGYERILLMASDSPHLSAEGVHDAFSALEAADVVLGRVRDGGYYLIGVRDGHDPISGVPMSIGDVSAGICRRAHELNLQVTEIASSFDVDVEADLTHLIAELLPDGCSAPATWEALHRLGLISPSVDGHH